ncbi:MAG: twin-arginine translocation signal domain-containing protein [Verrucomicrobiota bacterium]|nr:twin-arginine translocation signal domain-containing protein [Verrucomicrobiota bacterium]
MSKDNYQSRRDFLRLCGLAGLGVAAPMWFPAPARAEAGAAYEGP